MCDARSSIPTTYIPLIRDCGKGCPDAWRTFFKIYAPIVYRYARHARLPEFDADEVVANVMRNFMQAVRGGFEVDHSVGRFRFYLKTITNHEIAAQHRRARRGTADLADVPEPSADEPPAEQYWSELEREERLRACLDRLRSAPAISARDLQAFERYALNGEPAERVAKELRISRSRLYVIKHEVIQQLRKIRAQLDAVLGEV